MADGPEFVLEWDGPVPEEGFWLGADLRISAGRDRAWLVGWVEVPGEQVSYFALSMEGEEVWERWGPPELRLDLARTLLTAVGALPQD